MAWLMMLLFSKIRGNGEFSALRNRMVDEQIVRRGVADPRVLEAMRRVPRHLFVPPEARSRAYVDHPLPIGHGQTISQPYIVAKMTELLACTGEEKVLEIGTGSGYQTTMLAEVAREVHSIEIVEPLFRKALTLLEKFYPQVHLYHGDGSSGLPDEAPFDAILLTAAPVRIPETLERQVKVGGRIVAPIGEREQELVVWTRTPSGFERRTVFGVRFVPMTGDAMKTEDRT